MSNLVPTREHSCDASGIDIRTVRSRLVDRCLIYFAIVVPLGLGLSLARITEHGWHSIYFLHIAVAVLITTAAVLRNRLPYGVRACLLLSLLLMMGSLGLPVFGLVGGGLAVLIVFAVMTAVAFGMRAGLVACAIVLAIIVVTGTAVCTGAITFSFDVAEYASSVTAWSTIAVVIVVFLPVAIIALGVVSEHLAASLEDLRKSHEKLEAQNSELERFTYTVSHDLKSPLITIKGFTGMLRNDLAEEKYPQAEKDLDRISEAADRMNRLLTELLQLSRIGRVVNPPVHVGLDELAREAIELVGGEAAQAGIEFEISPDLPSVVGDRTRLLEVMQNLIGNAIKYMGDPSQPKVEVGSRRDGDETVCYVRDNGIGIEACYHERIFDLFDQLNPKAEGTGIGLSLVKRIVEVHGGRVWVESDGPGQGSTFCFTVASEPEST